MRGGAGRSPSPVRGEAQRSTRHSASQTFVPLHERSQRYGGLTAIGRRGVATAAILPLTGLVLSGFCAAPHPALRATFSPLRGAKGSHTVSTILPICAELSIRACALAASASGKVESIAGLHRPAASSGQTFSFSASAITAFSAGLR